MYMGKTLSHYFLKKMKYSSLPWSRIPVIPRTGSLVTLTNPIFIIREGGNKYKLWPFVIKLSFLTAPMGTFLPTLLLTSQSEVHGY